MGYFKCKPRRLYTLPRNLTRLYTNFKRGEKQFGMVIQIGDSVCGISRSLVHSCKREHSLLVSAIHRQSYAWVNGQAHHLVFLTVPPYDYTRAYSDLWTAMRADARCHVCQGCVGLVASVVHGHKVVNGTLFPIEHSILFNIIRSPLKTLVVWLSLAGLIPRFDAHHCLK